MTMIVPVVEATHGKSTGALPNRCRDCLGPGGRVTLDLLHAECRIAPDVGGAGTCGSCGRIDQVYDLPLLLALRRRGLLNVEIPGTSAKATHQPRISGDHEPDTLPMAHRTSFLWWPKTTDFTLAEWIGRHEDLLASHPFQTFLHPDEGEPSEHARLMAHLGSGEHMMARRRTILSRRPRLPFGLEDVRLAHDLWGANCGPTALAALLGLSIDEAVSLIPEFTRRKFTTEVQMAIALARLGTRWKWSAAPRGAGIADWPETGLVRIRFDGPWTGKGSRISELQRSHWVATWVKAGDGIRDVFDMNAMRAGGWLSHWEWEEHILPFVGESFEGWNGSWRTVEWFDIA